MKKKKKETKQHENWKTNHREISCTGYRCPDVGSGSCRGGLWGKRPRIAHAGHTCSQFKRTYHRAQLSSSATLLAPLGRHLDKGIKHQRHRSREQKQQETASKAGVGGGGAVTHSSQWGTHTTAVLYGRTSTHGESWLEQTKGWAGWRRREKLLCADYTPPTFCTTQVDSKGVGSGVEPEEGREEISCFNDVCLFLFCFVLFWFFFPTTQISSYLFILIANKFS